MPFFLYSKIDFVLDLQNDDSDKIPVGMFAEWHDGYFWRISMCSARRIRHEDFEKLDSTGKELLADPYGLLYHTADKYIKSKGWYQGGHILEDFLTKCFPCNIPIQAQNLFQQAISPEEDPLEVYEDLASNIPEPSRQAHWYRLDAPQTVPTLEDPSQEDDLLLD